MSTLSSSSKKAGMDQRPTQFEKRVTADLTAALTQPLQEFDMRVVAVQASQADLVKEMDRLTSGEYARSCFGELDHMDMMSSDSKHERCGLRSMSYGREM
jgi:two-component sensor histidine kinase